MKKLRVLIDGKVWNLGDPIPEELNINEENLKSLIEEEMSLLNEGEESDISLTTKEFRDKMREEHSKYTKSYERKRRKEEADKKWEEYYKDHLYGYEEEFIDHLKSRDLSMYEFVSIWDEDKYGYPEDDAITLKQVLKIAKKDDTCEFTDEDEARFYSEHPELTGNEYVVF